MASKFQKTTSNFFVTFFIGIIVVSFMFQGMESMRNSPDSVASVGNVPIKIREFQQEYGRQLEFYKNIMNQGRPLTSKQIEDFKIKENTLNNLVQRKLTLLYSNKIGYVVPNTQVGEQIKDLPYFKSGNKFDINRYKLLLRNNGLTPQDFEDDIANGIKGQTVQAMFSNYPLSKGYISAVQEFKKKKVKADIVEIKKSTLRKHVSVGDSEIVEYLKKGSNKARIEEAFKTRKPALDIPAQVHARHILIKAAPGKEKEAFDKIQKIQKEVNPRNFASLANKYTEDPSGKGKGGKLPAFSKGRMVPEFEKIAFSQNPGTVSSPVKTQFGYHLILVEKKTEGVPALFETHRDEIAKEFIQGEKTKELDELVKTVAAQAKEGMEAGNFLAVEDLQKKYGISLAKSVQINRYEGALDGTVIEAPDLKELFSDMSNFPRVKSFNSDSKIQILRIEQDANAVKEVDVKKEKRDLGKVLASKLREDVFSQLREKTKVRTFGRL